MEVGNIIITKFRKRANPLKHSNNILKNGIAEIILEHKNYFVFKWIIPPSPTCMVGLTIPANDTRLFNILEKKYVAILKMKNLI